MSTTLEDTNHVLCCPSYESCCIAHNKALTIFQQHLTKQHTPDIMASLLCTSMTSSWLGGSNIAPPTLTTPEEPIMPHLTRAFKLQSKIGWDLFFHGQIAKDWKPAIHTDYREQQPGTFFTLDQWMRTTSNQCNWDTGPHLYGASAMLLCMAPIAHSPWNIEEKKLLLEPPQFIKKHLEISPLWIV